MKKYKFGPIRILNAEETGITAVRNPRKIIAAKGMKQVNIVTS